MLSPEGRASGYAGLAAATVGLTLLLIAMGAVVRTTGSGLGCPDWPLCNGGVLPFDDRAATIEWTHRLLAAVTGIAITTLAIWTARRGRSIRSLATGTGLVALLAGQAYLGREAVLRELPPEVVALHLGSALLLLAILTWLAVEAGAPRPSSPLPGRWRFAAVAAGTSVLGVLTLGTLVVVNGAALACSDWPGCPEGSIPFLRGEHVQDIQWLHRLLALTGFIGLIVVGWLAHRWRLPRVLRLLSALMLVLYLAQAAIGALNVWWELPTAWRATHVFMANVLWMLAVVIIATAWRGTQGARHAVSG